MLAGLIGDLVPPDEPADVLILGFAVPDVRPERATAAFLSAACPGRPLAFAVCDQGCAAGFTALRLARDYAADGGAGRVLVALAEQTRLDYDPPAPASLPAGHAAFAMLCDAPGRDCGRHDYGRRDCGRRDCGRHDYGRRDCGRRDCGAAGGRSCRRLGPGAAGGRS
jgi:hypothetical protein